MREYDDDGSGEINFRKFVENVLDSRTGQADCISKVRPKGTSNVVSSDAGTSEHMLRRKIQMAKKELRSAFRDRDGDGKGDSIPIAEFRVVLEKFDIRMTDNQVCTPLRNRAAAFSLEFHRTTSGLLLRSDTRARMAQFKKLVKIMDEDGDGQISYKEFITYFKRDIDASNVLKPMTGLSLSEAKQMIKENIENKLPTGPAPLRRCWKYFDTDGSGGIDFQEFKHTLMMKANLCFGAVLLLSPHVGCP
jgi:Ca2+-binding EF-hand superfamily protein